MVFLLTKYAKHTATITSDSYAVHSPTILQMASVSYRVMIEPVPALLPFKRDLESCISRGSVRAFQLQAHHRLQVIAQVQQKVRVQVRHRAQLAAPILMVRAPTQLTGQVLLGVRLLGFPH